MPGYAETQLCPHQWTSTSLPRQEALPWESGLGRLTTLFLGLVRTVPTVVLPITLPAGRDAAA